MPHGAESKLSYASVGVFKQLIVYKNYITNFVHYYFQAGESQSN